MNTNLFDGAVLRLTDLPLKDFTKIPNSLKSGPSVPAKASLEVRWFNETLTTDATAGFSGRYFGNSATARWSAQEDGFTFSTDDGAAETNEFTLIGQERNGVFFP